MSQVEILSPAGSMESFRAAINAGADAVYMGGSMFGARAFADNFDETQIKKALELAHIHKRKVYLTVNTLLKNDELKKDLYDFLLPAYEWGLDAVLVQDFGVFEFIKANFPSLDIHASTQMTTNGALSAKFLEEKGFSRIVTSRELSLEEISQIRKETKLEIESFVHGALCYCYSGQCLMSGMIGGRSGNRGRCAQSCRLAYSALDEDGTTMGKKDKHLLSPKDMCALELLPDIIDAGVYSLKIEGRMKSPEYTAGVVSTYRKYVDMYLEKGRSGYKVDPQDLSDLMDLFNRGNFSKGYYVAQNGPKMMSMDRPNHQGTRAIQVVSSSRGQMKVKALSTLNPQDVVDVSSDFTWTNGQARSKDEVFSINIPATLKVAPGSIYYRVRNNKLVGEINERFIKRNIREQVRIEGEFFAGSPSRVSIYCNGTEYEIFGKVVDAAKNSPMDAKSIEKQLRKLGDTEFEASEVNLLVGDNIFVPVSELNELRRSLVQGITDKLTGKRSACNLVIRSGKDRDETLPAQSMSLYVVVHDENTLRVALQPSEVKRIYVDIYSLTDFTKAGEIVAKIHECGKEAYYCMPHIFRNRAASWYQKNLDLLVKPGWDGFLVRNLDELQFLRENGIKGSLVLDHHLYCMNDFAPEFFSGLSKTEGRSDGGSLNINGFTAPLELNHRELRDLRITAPMEILLYGYFPVMLSAQCVMKNLKECRINKAGEYTCIHIKDRKGKLLPVVNFCRWCYNVIYHPAPMNLMDLRDEISECGFAGLRVDLALLDAKEAGVVLSQTVDCIKNGLRRKPQGDFTRGHFLRGVE